MPMDFCMAMQARSAITRSTHVAIQAAEAAAALLSACCTLELNDHDLHHMLLSNVGTVMAGAAAILHVPDSTTGPRGPVGLTCMTLRLLPLLLKHLPDMLDMEVNAGVAQAKHMLGLQCSSHSFGILC